MDDRDRELLAAMLESSRLASEYVGDQGSGWLEDGKTVDAVAKRLEQVGELAKRVGAETLAAIPGVEWRGVKGLREIMAHDDGRVDLEVLADTVANHLPGLVEGVERFLEREG